GGHGGPPLQSSKCHFKIHCSCLSVRPACRSTTLAPVFLSHRPSLPQHRPATSNKLSSQLSDYQTRGHSLASSGATARSVHTSQTRWRPLDKRSRTSASTLPKNGRNTCRTSSGDESRCCTSALQTDTRSRSSGSRDSAASTPTSPHRRRKL